MQKHALMIENVLNVLEIPITISAVWLYTMMMVAIAAVMNGKI